MLAASTLIILFVEMNFFFFKNLLKEQFYLKEIRESFEIFRNVLDFYMQFSDLVHYSTGMC
jgi:hypothetical protein